MAGFLAASVCCGMGRCQHCSKFCAGQDLLCLRNLSFNPRPGALREQRAALMQKLAGRVSIGLERLGCRAAQGGWRKGGWHSVCVQTLASLGVVGRVLAALGSVAAGAGLVSMAFLTQEHWSPSDFSS